MVETFIMKQLAPSATTLTDYYTVPGATSTVIASIFVCNTTGADTTFRISLAPSGAGDAIVQYLYRDQQVLANDTYLITTGITLLSGTVMRIYAGSANITFTTFGSEIS